MSVTSSKPEPIGQSGPMQPPDRSPEQRHLLRRSMLGLGLGNTLEWYDWQVFGLLAATIGVHFFRTDNALEATLLTLSVFAVGFVARPLGGILLGGVADRVGRKAVMLWSVGVMAGTTLVIGVLPGVETIGWLAPVVLLVCRLLQGLSTGIEAPLSTAYGVEIMPRNRSGLAAGIISGFVNLGIMLGSLLPFLLGLSLGSAAMADWAWRIPFWVGAAMGVIVIWLRRSLPETLHQGEPEYVGRTPEIWRQVFGRWRSLLAVVFIVGAAQAFNYGWNIGLPNLARTTYHEDLTSVFGITTLLALFMVLGSPVVGQFTDRFRLGRTFLVGRWLMIPTVFLMLWYTSQGLGGFAAVLLLGAPVLLINMTLYVVTSTSLFPKGIRAAGGGLGYGVGVAVMGGTAGYLVVWLGSIGLSWLFPVYAATLALISIVLYQWARRSEGVFVGE